MESCILSFLSAWLHGAIQSRVDSNLHKNQGSGWNLNASFKCLLLQTPPLQSARNNSDIVKHYGQCSLYRNEISPGKHMPSVDLLCTAHQRWAVSSLSAPTCLGVFLEPVQQCGGSCTMGESPVQSVCMLPATFSGHFPTYWKNWSGHWWFNFFMHAFIISPI